MLFGENTKMILAGFSACMVSGVLATGMFSDQTWPYYAATGLIGAHLTWQVISHVCWCCTDEVTHDL